MAKRIKISQWDKDLFNYLHASKIATLEQIVRDLPYYSSRSSFIWRLWKLKKLGYLTGIYNEEHDGTNIYRLTKQTYKKYISDDLNVNLEIGSDAIFHDLNLVDIRSKFLNSSKVNKYYTENVIQSWEDENYKKLEPFKKNNTDAAIHVTMSDEDFWIGIEYEASTKGQKRYNELFSSYYLNDEVVAILYVCKTRSILNKLQLFESDLVGTKQKKIFYTTLDSILENGDLKFTNSDGISIDLND